MSRTDTSAPLPLNTHNFGTFAGVFTPSILTILGVIMFLRAGYVIGQAGILGALAILLAAKSVSLLTALSMGALATNTPVRGGGAYFLISRALGPQFGGAIGLALYLAQALSVPFYILGFSTALAQTFPALKPWVALMALLTTGVLFAVNFISAGFAIRVQYLVMALLGGAIITFLGGAALDFEPVQFQKNWLSSEGTGGGFWILFAIYFPAVTGILAGVNMSGDLKNPARSLVRGTLAAIGVGFLVYLLQIVLCGGAFPRADLIQKPYVTLLDHALLNLSWLVATGVFAATLSSAMGSLLGAPRVLQAVARDGVFRSLRTFGRGVGRGDEPRSALWLTVLLTVTVIGLGAADSGPGAERAFDVIAAIVAMFFLCTYGMINLAAFVERFGGNPSFRPRFRWHHWSVSLLGTLLCFGIMLRIDAAAALVATVLVGALYAVISRRVYRAAFGDARRGFLYALFIRILRGLQDWRPDPKNWRPTLLTFIGSIEHHFGLTQYSQWLEGGSGMVMAAQVFTGDIQEHADRRRQQIQTLRRYWRERDLRVFPEAVFCRDVDEGIDLLIQARSGGPIQANAVLFGWPRREARIAPLLRHLATARALGMSVLCLIDRGLPESDMPLLRIDIWWRGRRNGSLMMILAHLLLQNRSWRNGTLRVLRLIRDESGRAPAQQALAQLVQAARMDAEATVLVSADPFPAVLRRHSADATVVFLGMPESDPDAGAPSRPDRMLEGMPTTLLVASSGEADLFA